MKIPDNVLMRVLREKQRYAQAMTTQMSFNAGAVASWIERIRGDGITPGARNVNASRFYRRPTLARQAVAW